MAAGGHHGREHVLLFQTAFVVLLAEATEERRGAVQGVGRNRLAAAQPVGRLGVDQQGATQHAVFAHEVFDGEYLGGGVFRGQGRQRERRQAAQRHGGTTDPAAPAGIGRIIGARRHARRLRPRRHG